MTNPRPAREIAVRALLQRERTAEFIEDLLAKELARQPVDPIDRGLIQELTYGATRHQATLDWLIARKTQGRTQKEALQILLRLGLYQLFWLTRVPDHAAVHETVALAKSLGFGPQAGFVNAVLRGYLRERVATTQVLQDLRGQDPALACSHPSWLYERWQQRWGRDRAMALMEWNNQPPTTFARINRLRVEPVEAIQAWTTEGVRFEPVAVPWVPAGLIYRLTSHPAFATMPSFRAGWFYVQDPQHPAGSGDFEPQTQ
ncbi:MAG: transcription antitermination factor NusB [Verrucomicrobiota bacterium]